MSDKMQTLRCQHGAGHDWERPSQRGKPPRFCPEHKPADEAPRISVETSDGNGAAPTGQAAEASGGNSTGGDSAAATANGSATVNPFILKAQKEAEKARMAELRRAKTRKSEQRATEDREAMRQELAAIDARIQEANRLYEESLEKASHAQDIESVNQEYDKSDQRMRILMQTAARKRKLQQVLADDVDEARGCLTSS